MKTRSALCPKAKTSPQVYREFIFQHYNKKLERAKAQLQ